MNKQPALTERDGQPRWFWELHRPPGPNQPHTLAYCLFAELTGGAHEPLRGARVVQHYPSKDEAMADFLRALASL